MAKACNMPPCPSGLSASRDFSLSNTRPVCGIDRRHRSLAENSARPLPADRSCSLRRRYSIVSACVAGLVIKYSGMRMPGGPRRATIFSSKI